MRTGSSMPASPARASSSPTTRLPKSTSTAVSARRGARSSFDVGYLGLLLPGRQLLRRRRPCSPPDPACLRRHLAKRQRRQIGCELLRSLRQDRPTPGPIGPSAPTSIGRRTSSISARMANICPARSSSRRRRRWPLVRSAGTCRVNSAVSGWAPAMPSTATIGRMPATSEWHPGAELQHLERWSRLHLEGVHARSALLRHRPDQGECNAFTSDPRAPLSASYVTSDKPRPWFGGGWIQLVRRALRRQAVG